jgi:hypothetical protein
MMALREPKHVGAAFIILTILIMQRFKIHVHYLDNKVFDYSVVQDCVPRMYFIILNESDAVE